VSEIYRPNGRPVGLDKSPVVCLGLHVSNDSFRASILTLHTAGFGLVHDRRSNQPADGRFVESELSSANGSLGEINPAISKWETLAARLRRRHRSNRFLTIATSESRPPSFSARMHNPISIRDIRPGDLQEVLRINEESSPGVSQLTVAGAERLITDATLAWVAVADQGIAGYLIAFIGSAI
jgi:hypothetical protein